MEKNAEHIEINRANFIKSGSLALAYAACPLLLQCANMGDGAEADPGATVTSSDEGITVSSGTLTLDLNSSTGQTLQSGGAILVSDQSLLITHQSASYKAFSNSCTHQGAAVNPSGGQLKCSLHAGIFNLNGAAVSGPPSLNLTEKTVSVSGTTLTVTL